jgi:hypothetical protein
MFDAVGRVVSDGGYGMHRAAGFPTAGCGECALALSRT